MSLPPVPADNRDQEIQLLRRRVDHLERMVRVLMRSQANSLFGMNITYIVPEMVAPSQEGYTVSASSFYDASRPPFNAFHDGNGIWSSRTGNLIDSWIQVQLPCPKVSNVVVLSARNDQYPNYTPDQFQIQGSNDGTNFIILFEVRTSWRTPGEEQIFVFDNDREYLFYRIVTKHASVPANDQHAGFRRIKFGQY